MAILKKYDLQGKECGTVEIDDTLLQDKGAHPQSVKDYIVAIRKNARQWSASTKTRAEINRTGRKPHPQKGQGRARQGDLAAPQYKGGGIVFGPRPKFDQHVRINKKERRAAIRSLLIEKIKENRVYVLEGAHFSAPKTRKMASFFQKLEIDSRRILILGESKQEMGNPHINLAKSLRNLPKKHYALLPQMNGYSLAVAQEIVLLDTAVDEFLSVFGVGSSESV